MQEGKAARGLFIILGAAEIKLFSMPATGTLNVGKGRSGSRATTGSEPCPEQDLLLVLDQRRGHGFQFKLSPMFSFH